MISDRELFVQILERDVLNLYSTISKSQSLLNIPAVQRTIFSYADKGITYLTNILFGEDGKGDIEEAAEMATFLATDKIEEYRKKIREQKQS